MYRISLATIFFHGYVVLKKPRLTIILLTFSIFLITSPAEADPTIVALQSVKAPPYNEAFNGFKEALDPNVNIQRIILSDLPARNSLSLVREAEPVLVLAIGIDALSRAKNLQNTPIVHVMARAVPGDFSSQGQITGVKMIVNPDRQVKMLKESLPRITSIGLLHDPEQTGGMVWNIKQAAAENGISVVAKEVFRAQNVPPSVMLMKEKVDLFWMLPDLTLITPETVEFLLMFSVESKIPILTFSKKYVEKGALLSIGVAPFEMGRQAGGMAEKILSGADAASMPCQNAKKAILAINMKIAKKLGIHLSQDVLERALIIK